VEKLEEVVHFVDTFGLPVMLKAAMGGGGRGMRVVKDREDLEDLFYRASSEAKAAFGDGVRE
jgi:pyruvate carboxylase